MQNIDQHIGSHKARLHRTGHYSPEQIEALQAKADGQEKDIARYYFKRHARSFAPSQVHQAFDERWPITSVRRAITNLTDEGILRRTTETVTGPYGKPEHLWKWRVPQPGQGQAELFKEKPKSKGPYEEAQR